MRNIHPHGNGLSPAARRAVWERTRVRRFWLRVDQTGGPDACWLWQGWRDRDGYGQVGWRGRMTRAHRLAFVLAGSAIPEGLTLDHLCRVKHCVNPRHLEAVSHRTNILRGNTLAARNAATRQCPRGHPYEGDNLYVNRAGRRVCRTCDRISSRAWQAQQRRARKQLALGA
jgi:hypothetical protein